MNKITVDDKATLDALEHDSALTFEGMSPSEKNLGDILAWVKEYTPLKREDAYVVSGSLMNRTYNLTGDNAYPETGCHLVCVKLSDMENPGKVVIPRFQVGGRWFDDVVANNEMRERDKRGE